jgi:hypothetical protein
MGRILLFALANKVMNAEASGNLKPGCNRGLSSPTRWKPLLFPCFQFIAALRVRWAYRCDGDAHRLFAELNLWQCNSAERRERFVVAYQAEHERIVPPHGGRTSARCWPAATPLLLPVGAQMLFAFVESSCGRRVVVPA